MAKSVPAIFLDRDGTINVDHGYVHEIDNFEFIDGVIDAMRELKKMGFALVVVTNQSGIARGKFTEAQFETLTEWMDWSLADRDVDLDGIYYCPHHPQGSVEEFRQVCDCRKPHPGMLLSARDYLHIDMVTPDITKDDVGWRLNVSIMTKLFNNMYNSTISPYDGKKIVGTDKIEILDTKEKMSSFNLEVKDGD